MHSATSSAAADAGRASSTYDAEYLALTQLQGDAFITLDEGLARAVERVVTLASIDELLTIGRASG